MKGENMLIVTMSVQGFARIFPLYQKLNPNAQTMVEEAVTLLNTPGLDKETWQAAISTLSDIFYPSDNTEEESIKIARKKEEDSDTPCERCEKTPTHLIKFSQGNRTEEHYFCEECEGEAIDANEEE